MQAEQQAKDTKPLDDVIVYRTGICYCSVCTSLTDIEEITRQVNAKNPADGTGAHFRWEKSEDAMFHGGKKPNPCPCDAYPNRMHYLFTC